MIRSRRVVWPLAATVVLVTGLPASAHGLGGRLDLPIPIWQFAWVATFAVMVSFAMLGRFWTQPRLASAASGTPLPTWIQGIARGLLPVARLIGLLMLSGTVYAAFWGSPATTSNMAPYAAFVLVWVGFAVASALVGDLWETVNPYTSLASLSERTRSKIPLERASEPARGGESVALIGLLAFVWIELAFHQGAAPRTIGWYLVAYAVVVVAGGISRGSAWARRADGFSVLFRTLSALGPLYRNEDGVLRLRYPVAGLARMRVDSGTVRLVLVIIGATTFDGLSRSAWWLEVASNRTGWELTAVNTGGLMFGIGLVMALYRVAIAVMARITGQSEHRLGNVFGPSLIPIAVAYTVAHYFSFLVFEGQHLIRLASDPFGLGWNLVGTTHWSVNYTLVSTGAIAWTQTVSIAAGHMLAVLVAHDRSVEEFPPELAVRSQYPMLAVMITFTVGGLFLLLG